MPQETRIDYQTIGSKKIPWYVLERGWQHSPRVNGRLVLIDLPYNKSETKMSIYRDPQNWGVPTSVGPVDGNYDEALRTAEKQSYQRMRGKMYKGNAALGITIATYKQSRGMIVDRYKTITSDVAQLYADAHRSKRAGRDASGLILEGIFGWQPLVADIHAATTSVIQSAPTGGYVSAMGTGNFSWDFKDSNPYIRRNSYGSGRITHRRTASYVVENPNKWLSERAGLLNPLAVAWDLVPWSFAINMFTNVGQLVNQVTDYAGLDFVGGTQTWTQNHIAFQTVDTSPPFQGSAISGGSRLTKRRTVGNSVSPPSLRLEFRLPEANWSLAAIAASLTTQKVSGLMRAFPINRRIYTE